MTRTQTILIFIAVLLIFLAGALYFFMGSEGDTSTPANPDTVFPGENPQTSGGGSGGSEPKLTIKAYDGSPIDVHNFKKDADVSENPNVPGQYEIAGDILTDPGKPYHIFYQETDTYFGISIYREPLGENRKIAEKILQDKLGLSPADMCRLSYVVAPGPGVNNAYAGDNLGFSYCKGAVVLPD